MIQIVDRDGNKIPFHLNKLQNIFMDDIEKYNIILKGRQFGFSSLACALALYYCLTENNVECLLVSYDLKSVGAIFKKLKFMYSTIPNIRAIKPKLDNDNKTEICFENGSRIVIATCGNKDIARGMTLRFAHLSEYALWRDNAEEQLLAIEQALRTDGIIIIESTAKGINHFENLYSGAESGENLYKAFFFNWFDEKEMYKNEYKKFVDIWLKRKNKMLEEKDLSGYEKQLLEQGATIEQLIWRRLKIANNGKNGDAKFRQEFPSYPMEAFLTTGASVFNQEKLLNRSRYLPKPIIIEELPKLPKLLQNHYGSNLFIYEDVKPGVRYFVGVDCAEGLRQDYSVIEVYSKEGVNVAEFYSNTIEPYKFAEIINELGKYFNKGYLVIEKASVGVSIIEKVRRVFGYMNMHKHRMFDDRGKKLTVTLGFKTSTSSKSVIIQDLKEMFEEGDILINSKTTLEEMKVFSLKDGKLAAVGNKKDDRVIATALAVHGLKSGIYYI